MENTQNTTRRLPKIGMRNIKTALAAALCALIYYFFDRSPAFACIGAVFGMGSDLVTSKQHGGNRFFGTVIGGLIGMGLFRIHLIFYPEGGFTWMLIPLLAVGVVVMILLCQMFWAGGVQPGGVMLCIILFNTPVDAYISYSLSRIIDTGVGVLVALVVNSLFPGGMTFEWFVHLWRNLLEKRRAYYHATMQDAAESVRRKIEGKEKFWE